MHVVYYLVKAWLYFNSQIICNHGSPDPREGGEPSRCFDLLKDLEAVFLPTVQLHYNVSHYSVVFDITQLCHGSQNDYYALCAL